MRLVGVIVVLSLATAVAGYASDTGANLEALIIGSWACESGNCPDEEVRFSIDEGIRSYNSWLHERPSASNGTWKIDEGRLTIECCAGLTYEYAVVRITETELVLTDAETSSETVLTRIK